MKYYLSQFQDCNKAKLRLKSLIKKGVIVDITEKKPVRTLSQNKYIHVIFCLYGIQYGYSIEESKTRLKRLCPFMLYTKKGEKYLRQTSKLDTMELTTFIEWIRNYCAMDNFYILSPKEYLKHKTSIDNEIERNKEFL